MGSPYIGEIRMFGGNFAPLNWALCQGQLVSIAENDALFVLLGTTYGGDGVNTFALPNFQGRVPVHQGSGYVIGQVAGTESVTLNTSQLPVHTHTMSASSAATGVSDPTSAYPASNSATKQYAASSNAVMNPTSTTGSGIPHDNMPPFLCITFIIALYGIFPTQN